METKEKPKDPNDLREYEAIPNGGALLCAAIALASLAVLFMTPAFRKVALVGVIFGVALLTMAVTRAPTIVQWLKSYWRRNVRGYVVAHYTEGGRAKCSDPFPRGYERLDVFLNSYPFVVLWPLGGWFSRPRAYWRAWRSGWSVARDTRFPGTPVVRVTDKNDSSLHFEKLEDAMSFIAARLERAATEPFWHDHSDMPLSWLRVLEGLAEDRDDARRDRGLAEREREEAERQRAELERQMTALFDRLHTAVGNLPFYAACPLMERIEAALRHLIVERNLFRGKRDEAANFVDGLAKEIEQGSRLSGTIEGLRLLDRMLNWLCWATVKDSPEHRAAQDRLAVVRERLADKQKRDRRRHGRGAATSAT